MRNNTKFAGLFTFLFLSALVSSSYGVAAFARQTGLECGSCHASAGFPALNSFGAAFKAAGYTQGGGVLSEIEGDHLGLPGALNLGVVFKARVKAKLDGVTNQFGVDLEIPDETAVFAAGKVADGVGFVIELGDAWFNSFKLVFAPEVGPVRVGLVPWFTDAFGAGWAFETLSTGAVRNIRIIEDRNLVSAQSATSWGGGEEAAGLGLYVWHPFGFVALTPFSAIHLEDVQSLGYYARVAVTAGFDFADMALGGAYKLGTQNGFLTEDTWLLGTKTAITSAHTVEYNWFAVDAQAVFTEIPLTLIATYASDLVVTLSYLTVAIDYLVLEGGNPLGVALAYRQAFDVNGSSQVGGAVKYGISQNVRVSLDVHYDLTRKDLQILPMVSGSW